MLSTRSKGEASLTKFTDNPERIGKRKPKKKTKKMADAGTPETTQQPDTGDKNHTPNREDNEDETQNTDPMHEMYLPDLNNILLSQALKTRLDYRMEDEVMVGCPKLKQYFRVDTFLVQRISGLICREQRNKEPHPRIYQAKIGHRRSRLFLHGPISPQIPQSMYRETTSTRT